MSRSEDFGSLRRHPSKRSNPVLSCQPSKSSCSAQIFLPIHKAAVEPPTAGKCLYCQSGKSSWPMLNCVAVMGKPRRTSCAWRGLVKGSPQRHQDTKTPRFHQAELSCAGLRVFVVNLAKPARRTNATGEPPGKLIAATGCAQRTTSALLTISIVVAGKDLPLIREVPPKLPTAPNYLRVSAPAPDPIRGSSAAKLFWAHAARTAPNPSAGNRGSRQSKVCRR